MRHGTAGLIVPIRDRRQRRRILTLKNFRNAVLVLVAIYGVILIEEHFRDPKNTKDYGRLYSPRVDSTTAVKKPEVIREGAPIPDANSADPMLVAPAAREQLLRADSNMPGTTTVTTAQAIPSPSPLAGRDAAGNLVVVGGPEGVTIVQKAGGRPVLGGGFGKQ